MVRTVRFTSAILAGLLGLVAAASAQVTVLSPAQQCVASANAGGTGNALTIPLLPCGASTNILLLNVTKTNTAAAPTLQMLGFAAHPIVASDGSAVPAGALMAGNTVMLNSQGQSWRLLTRTDGLTNALTNSFVWIGNIDNQAQPRQISGAATIDNTGVLALQATPATAELNTMIGDSGAGGVKGLAGAPTAGDAAAGKYWSAAGTWSVPSGGAPMQPTITYTGVWNEMPSFVSWGPIGVSAPNGQYFTSVGGVTLDGMPSRTGNGSNLQQVSFDNVTGVWGAISIFSGSVPSVTSVSFPELKVTGSDFSLSTLPNISTFSAPVLKAIGENFSPSELEAIAELSLPELEYVGTDFFLDTFTATSTVSVPKLGYVGGTLALYNNPALVSVDASLLTSVVDLQLKTNVVLPGLNLPALTNISAGVQISDTGAMTTLGLPVLTQIGKDVEIGASGLGDAPNLSILTLTNLSTVGYVDLSTFGVITIENAPNLTAVNLPGIRTLRGLIVDNTDGVTSVNFGANLKRITNLTVQSPLTQANVDAILVKLVALDGTNGTTLFATGSSATINDLAATPSATGLAAKATLNGRGASVTTK